MTVLLAVLCGNNASPAGIAHTMTFSKMRMADLESATSGHAYNRREHLSVAHAGYTNHGNGRYHYAPASVHYVVSGRPVPVASAVSETASQHEPVPPAYATTRHEITPYAASARPYPRDGFINYDADQLAKYARLFGPSSLAVGAAHYTLNALRSSGTRGNVNNKRNDYEENNESNVPTEKVKRTTIGRKKRMKITR